MHGVKRKISEQEPEVSANQDWEWIQEGDKVTFLAWLCHGL